MKDLRQLEGRPSIIALISAADRSDPARLMRLRARLRHTPMRQDQAAELDLSLRPGGRADPEAALDELGRLLSRPLPLARPGPGRRLLRRALLVLAGLLAGSAGLLLLAVALAA